MQAIDGLDAETLHHSVSDHSFAAAAALFRGLEDHHCGPVEITGLGEVLGGAEKHRGMAIVATGMHTPRRGGTIGQIPHLLDRQRVHVRAQADGAVRTVRPAPDEADDPGAADAGGNLVAAEIPQLVGDEAGSAMDVVLQLRMGVEVVPPCGDLIRQSCDPVDDGHGVTSLRASWLVSGRASRP